MNALCGWINKFLFKVRYVFMDEMNIHVRSDRGHWCENKNKLKVNCQFYFLSRSWETGTVSQLICDEKSGWLARLFGATLHFFCLDNPLMPVSI